MRLILIRHGKTEANEHHLYCGSTDLPLSETGRQELDARKNSYPSVSGFHIVTSGLRRCEETLSVLFGDLPHETYPAFAEMDFGRFEMFSYEQLKNDVDYISWITGNNEANLCPGGESGELMTRRVLTALYELIENDRDTLVVTHGGPIAAIMAELFPDERKNRYEWQPASGGGYEITFADGKQIYSRID